MAPPPDTNPSPSLLSRSPLALALSGVILVMYLIFVYLVGFEKAFLGTQITPGLSWGILLGALVIIVSWVLTLVYLLASNRPAAAVSKS